MASDSRLFVICVGGSGAKCLESIVHMAAAGLYSEQPIEVLMVDPDEANGSVERALRSLNVYQTCQQSIAGEHQADSPWMRTSIKSYGLWSPFADLSTNKELDSLFQYNTVRTNNPALANLLEVLYSPEERSQQLDVGFRGRPSIGSAVMSQINLDQLSEAPWGTLIQEIKNAAGGGKKPRILLCGSIFGGTGASGLPTIARLLRNKFEREKILDSVSIGGLFLLPYFSFTVPPGANTEGLFASADQFLLNTEAALRYYVTQARDLFDTVYLLGNEDNTNVNFSVGNRNQQNRPHFIELYAALAARDFLFQDRNDALMLMARENSGKLVWNDLPESMTIKRFVVNAARCAYMWLSDIEKELNAQTSMGYQRKMVPWMNPFYDLQESSSMKFDAPQQQSMIKMVTDWSSDYLRWLHDLHQCETDQVQLLNTKLFGSSEQLDKLIVGDIRDSKVRQRQDDLAQIKTALMKYKSATGQRGTAGLATALYQTTSI
jgi:Tubulin like